MRKLIFEPSFDTSLDRVWQLFTEVENYPQYIKFCQKAELIGPFAPGSSWVDRSTVMYLPMNVVHEIVTVDPERKIEYKIKLPGGGALWQRFSFSEGSGKTKLLAQIEIDFQNKLMDILVGPIVESRNKTMIERTIANFQERLKHETS